jgi:predicted GIY-YIG superfamily endonuclease
MIIVYVIQSIPTGKLYVGQTAALEARLLEHNLGRSKYTSSFRPWRIIYSESFPDRIGARKREKYLKSTAGKNYLRKLKLI